MDTRSKTIYKVSYNGLFEQEFSTLDTAIACAEKLVKEKAEEQFNPFRFINVNIVKFDYEWLEDGTPDTLLTCVVWRNLLTAEEASLTAIA